MPDRLNFLSNQICRKDQEFLPGALMVQRQPPHPLARITSFLILALIVIALIWAVLGRVDIVASAQGKLVPVGSVKVVQTMVPGRVQEILVSSGDSVQKGAVLVRLDSAPVLTEIQQLELEIDDLDDQIARLSDYASWVSAEADRDLKSQLINADLLLDRSEIATYENTRLELLQRIQQLEIERIAASTEIALLKERLPIAQSKKAAADKLLSNNLISESDYLEIKEAHLIVQQQLRSAELSVERALLGKAQAETSLLRLRSQTLAEIDQRLSTLKLSRETSGERLLYLKDQLKNYEVRAPIDGQVKDLAIHTQDGVVTAAQELMQLVPVDYRLEGEAWIANKDIAQITVGQPVEIKLEAFPFTEFGVLEGQIRNISADANQLEQGQLVYKAGIEISSNQLPFSSDSTVLIPGMSITAEMRLGERRIIEFFLDPLLRYRDESLREI